MPTEAKLVAVRCSQTGRPGSGRSRGNDRNLNACSTMSLSASRRWSVRSTQCAMSLAHHRQAQGRRKPMRRTQQRRCGRQTPRDVSANTCDEALCQQPRPAEGHQSLRRTARRRLDFAENFSANTRPRKPKLKRREEVDPKPPSPAQLSYAKNIAQGKVSSVPRRPRPTRPP